MMLKGQSLSFFCLTAKSFQNAKNSYYYIKSITSAIKCALRVSAQSMSCSEHEESNNPLECHYDTMKNQTGKSITHISRKTLNMSVRAGNRWECSVGSTGSCLPDSDLRYFLSAEDGCACFFRNAGFMHDFSSNNIFKRCSQIRLAGSWDINDAISLKGPFVCFFRISLDRNAI